MTDRGTDISRRLILKSAGLGAGLALATAVVSEV